MTVADVNRAWIQARMSSLTNDTEQERERDNIVTVQSIVNLEKHCVAGFPMSSKVGEDVDFLSF